MTRFPSGTLPAVRNVAWLALLALPPLQAQAFDSSSPARADDCQNGTVLDDGSFENGITGLASASDFDAVMAFPVSTDLGTLEKFCTCFIRTGLDSRVEYQIVGYNNDGPGGQPGTVRYVSDPIDFTIPSPGVPFFSSFDLSSDPELLRVVSDGDFLGIRFDPGAEQGIFLCVDEGPNTEPQPGYISIDQGQTWESVGPGRSRAGNVLAFGLHLLFDSPDELCDYLDELGESGNLGCAFIAFLAYLEYCCDLPLDPDEDDDVDRVPTAESRFLIDRLRSVRDQVFAADPDGRRLIDFYYRFSPLLAQRLTEDRELALESYETLRKLQPIIQARLGSGQAILGPAEIERINAVLDRLNPHDGSELALFLDELQAAMLDASVLERFGVGLIRAEVPFDPLVSYVDVVPATPGASAGVRMVAEISGADLQLGRFSAQLPAGFVPTLTDLPPGPVGSVRFELPVPGASAELAILSDGQRFFLDRDSDGVFSATDFEIAVSAQAIEVVFPFGGDGLDVVTHLPGAPRGRVTIEIDPGFFRSPSAPRPTGEAVGFQLTAVDQQTGRAEDGTRMVSYQRSAVVADRSGRLTANPLILDFGAIPSLSAALVNTGAAGPVDLYLGILRPDGALFTLDSNLQWSAGVAPVVQGFPLATGFQIAGVALPPASVFDLSGDYHLYFAAVAPGTFDLISLTDTVVRVAAP